MVEAEAVTPAPRAREGELHAFVVGALERVAVSWADARCVADALVAADLRGVESHGVARLDSFYVKRVENGVIVPQPDYTTLRESPSSIALDAGNGLGHPAARHAMERVIEKARDQGIAFGTVRNSNHFGIAAYYAMLALEHDMIGIALTNSTHLALPTFGRERMLGTNPFAYAIPAGAEPAFVLDFSTTTVTLGKLQVAERKNQPLRPGWAVDSAGRETLEATAAFNGALLPLGGLGVETGGHKGYGLGLLCDILCGVLAGGAFAGDLHVLESGTVAGLTSHWFAAMRIDRIRDVADFKRDLDRELRAMKDSAKAPGHQRIYVAGEIEYEKTLEHRRSGIPLHPKVFAELDAMAERLGIHRLTKV